MLASANQVRSHLLGRLIDPSGDLIFSNDYSYIVCAVCDSLLSAEGSPMTCQCGASIVCLGCQKELALAALMTITARTRNTLRCGCEKATEKLNDL